MEPKLKPIDEQVVVTGALSGIGLATAQDAAQAGAKLALAARSEKRLAEIVDSINEEGGEAIYVVADVGNGADVRRVADAAISRRTASSTTRRPHATRRARCGVRAAAATFMDIGRRLERRDTDNHPPLAGAASQPAWRCA